MSSRIWLPALCLCAAACGPEAAPSPSLPPSSARPAIAVGSYLLRVPPQDLGPILPEPHPSWMVAIEARWLQLYGH